MIQRSIMCRQWGMHCIGVYNKVHELHLGVIASNTGCKPAT